MGAGQAGPPTTPEATMLQTITALFLNLLFPAILALALLKLGLGS